MGILLSYFPFIDQGFIASKWELFCIFYYITAYFFYINVVLYSFLLKNLSMASFRSRYLLLGLFIINLSAVAKDRYYCDFPLNLSSIYFDRIIFISDTKSGRVVGIDGTEFGGKAESVLKTYDEGDRIISVYERDFPKISKSEGRNFILFIFDLSNEIFYRSYAYHMSPDRFKKAYHKSPEEYFVFVNRNPELIKYLPAIERPNQFAHVFIKTKYPCYPINYLEYIIKSSFILFSKILAG